MRCLPVKTCTFYLVSRYTATLKLIGICALDANKLKDAPNGKPLYAAFVFFRLRKSQTTLSVARGEARRVDAASRGFFDQI
jgi:hypothetical protein